MGKPLFRRRIRFATATMPAAIAACAFATFWITPIDRSAIDPVLVVARGGDRCRRRVVSSETDGGERLKLAVEAGEVTELAAVARMPLPSERRPRWLCLKLQACPHCADRMRLTLVDLRSDHVLAGPSQVAASQADLVQVGARGQETARPFVGVRLLS